MNIRAPIYIMLAYEYADALIVLSYQALMKP